MWDTAVQEAIGNGLWAVLFVILLAYVLKVNSEREAKYQQTIDKLADKFDLLKEVESKLDDMQQDIKEYLRR